MGINITKEELLQRIEKLEEQISLLLGKPRGPIGLMEYADACKRKDKAMIRRFLIQEGEKGDLWESR